DGRIASSWWYDLNSVRDGRGCVCGGDWFDSRILRVGGVEVEEKIVCFGGGTDGGVL
ncbi:hypothetical protein A2U01_0030972, partial [Trifolium medium]|nr:hypothetical protein [Trifolium medium]